MAKGGQIFLSVNEAGDLECFQQQVMKNQLKEEELVEPATQSYTSSEWKVGVMRLDGGGGGRMDVRRGLRGIC